MMNSWLVFSSRPYEGIWECLSSQKVVDFARLKVSEGKELREISEQLCDYCLAPDTEPPRHKRGCSCRRCDEDYEEILDDEIGIGCDNMTVVIVAILHGRTKEDWYTWVTGRVKQAYGYATPTLTPQLYAHDRLMTFKAQRERLEKEDPQAVQAGRTHSSGGYQILVMADEKGYGS
jgi:protein phosphatase 2C family protein 2/3